MTLVNPYEIGARGWFRPGADHSGAAPLARRTQRPSLWGESMKRLLSTCVVVFWLGACEAPPAPPAPPPPAPTPPPPAPYPRPPSVSAEDLARVLPRD